MDGKKTAGTLTSDGATLDLRLIPEFDGKSHAVVEWLEKVELVCKLRGITELHNVVPLRLSAGAFSVYQQLSSTDKEDYENIKTALISAFATDKFLAYEQFVARKLRDGEPVDVYLADLRRLAGHFGGISDEGLGCAFVAGLPEAARHVLRAGCRLESMSISQLLTRARAVLTDDSLGVGSPTHASCLSQHATTPASSDGAAVRCLSCNQLNHYARDCLVGRGARRGGRGSVRCYNCGRRGHVAAMCSGNAPGEESSAPASSLHHQ